MIAHRTALLATLKLLLAAPLASFFNVSVIGVAVALPLTLHVLVTNMHAVVGRIPTTTEATIFLKPSATPSETMRLEKQLKSHPEIAKVQVVDRAIALKEISQRSGIGELVGNLGENPLPDSILIELKQAGALELVLATIRKDPAVDEVEADSAWARRFSSIVDLGERTTRLLAGLLLLTLALVTANTVRLQILTRRDEIEVSKLIGATDHFIRRPFLYFSALQGGMGALLGWGIVLWVVAELNPPLEQFAQLYGETYRLSTPSLEAVATVFAGALVASLLGALFAVRRHLRQLDAA
ncbi:permease-like cell division protein FtsX [Parachitinimonas caeni]|uniref:Cell division protein FtsX n=1 Tax=Parachitinimonas caeni TaxID=3031301 RepID=A0ABT7DT20_9NEIS|nr:permease-like cell division protein FtsX [Parachitinimonas caeni]MDK2123227.1 permease-like cell division protein FtsX [Parachitinimonas caeni]